MHDLSPLHSPTSSVAPSLPSSALKALSHHGLTINQDGNVDWAEKSLSHPRNYRPLRKTYDAGLIIFLDFFTTGISAGGTPAATFALEQFHISPTMGIFAFTSIYLIGQALGGLLFSPYSETFGRRWLYIFSSLFYGTFCVLVGAAPNVGAVFAGRFITGFLSAIPSVIVSGSIEDLFDTESRIWMFFAWSVIVNLGLIVGPLFAFYVAQAAGWRFIFYASAIVLVLVAGGMLGISESRPGTVLGKLMKKIRKENPDIELPPAPSTAMPSVKQFVRTSLVRPWVLFFTEPIVSIVSVLSAVVFALIYLLTAAIPAIGTEFGLKTSGSMLVLLFVGFGLISSVLTRFYDRHVARKYRKQNRVLTPEAKLTGFVIAAPVLAISLWTGAWTIPPIVRGVPWVVPAIALVLLGYATNEFDTVLAGYLADSYTEYAASAFTSLAFLRALLSAVFPLFAEKLFQSLGNNGAGSLLAGIATLFCVAPVILVRYGKELRRRSKYGGGEGVDNGDGEGGGRGMEELTSMLEREREWKPRASGKIGMRHELPPRVPTYRTFEA